MLTWLHSLGGSAAFLYCECNVFPLEIIGVTLDYVNILLLFMHSPTNLAIKSNFFWYKVIIVVLATFPFTVISTENIFSFFCFYESELTPFDLLGYHPLLSLLMF